MPTPRHRGNNPDTLLSHIRISPAFASSPAFCFFTRLAHRRQSCLSASSLWSRFANSERKRPVSAGLFAKRDHILVDTPTRHTFWDEDESLEDFPHDQYSIHECTKPARCCYQHTDGLNVARSGIEPLTFHFSGGCSTN